MEYYNIPRRVCTWIGDIRGAHNTETTSLINMYGTNSNFHLVDRDEIDEVIKQSKLKLSGILSETECPGSGRFPRGRVMRFLTCSCKKPVIDSRRKPVIGQEVFPSFRYDFPSFASTMILMEPETRRSSMAPPTTGSGKIDSQSSGGRLLVRKIARFPNLSSTIR